MRTGRFGRTGVLVATAVVALFATGCWRVGPIDGPGAGAGGGRTTDDVHADKSGAAVPVVPGFPPLLEPVVAYYDTTAHRLRIGIDAPSLGWHFLDLDGAGVAGGAGRVADDVGKFVSISTAFVNGGPQIDGFYADVTAGRLRHFSATGLGFTLNFEDVDGPGVAGGGGRTSDESGLYNSAVWLNGPHDFSSSFDKADQQRLRHTWFDGSTWHYEDVDGSGATSSGATTDNVGSYVSAKVTGTGLHAFYADSTTGRLRYAHFDGSIWRFETVDGAGSVSTGGTTTHNVGQDNAVAYSSPSAQLHFFTGDSTNGDLRSGCSTTFGAPAPAVCDFPTS